MPSTEEVETVLRRVVDPEVGINVVDLGLVYGIDLSPGRIGVRLTMTTPACPVGGHLRDQARRFMQERFPDVGAIEVELVLDPPWHPGLMKEEARKALGWGDGPR